MKEALYIEPLGILFIIYLYTEADDRVWLDPSCNTDQGV